MKDLVKASSIAGVEYAAYLVCGLALAFGSFLVPFAVIAMV